MESKKIIFTVALLFLLSLTLGTANAVIIPKNCHFVIDSYTPPITSNETTTPDGFPEIEEIQQQNIKGHWECPHEGDLISLYKINITGDKVTFWLDEKTQKYIDNCKVSWFGFTWVKPKCIRELAKEFGISKYEARKQFNEYFVKGKLPVRGLDNSDFKSNEHNPNLLKFSLLKHSNRPKMFHIGMHSIIFEYLPGVNYPTPYVNSLNPVFVFYQTDINTTLAADISDSDTSIQLTDATGFEKPGVLYFPSNGEIMRITGVSGNIVTVVRDTRTGGCPVTAHSAGETVVYAHLVRYTNNPTALKVFRDNAKPGDWFAVGTYYTAHILESVDFNIVTPAQYDSATFKVYEAKYFYSSQIKQYQKWVEIDYHDGTHGFTQSGTMSFHNFEGAYSHNYHEPDNFYNYMYDENGYYYLAFYIKIELANATGWTQGAEIDFGSTQYYEKVLRPTNAGTLTFEDIYQADLNTPLKLTENDTVIRDPTLYTAPYQSLFADVTSFTSSGDLTVKGFKVENALTYATFSHRFRNCVFTDFARGQDFFMYENDYKTPIYEGTDWKTIDGRFSGSKALWINSTYTGSKYAFYNPHFFEGYPQPKTWSVEVWFKSEKDGVIMHRNRNYYYAYAPLWAFYVYNENIKFRVEGEDGAHIIYTSFTNDNNWHHLVGVYDGDKIYLYLDGQLKAYDTVGKLKDASQYTYLYIGDKISSTSNKWQGAIDEFTIYPYALSSDEVSAHYTNSQNNYIFAKEETISISGTGEYKIGEFSYITEVSHTGDFEFNIYQNRLGVFDRQDDRYISYVDFGLRYSTIEDATNAVFQVGTNAMLGHRCFNMILTDSGGLNPTHNTHFQMGEKVEDENGTSYINGGELILYNTFAQGSYRNYFYYCNFYGTTIKYKTSSIETSFTTRLLGTSIQSMTSSAGSFALYGNMILDKDFLHRGNWKNVYVYWYEKVPLYKKDTQEVADPVDLTIEGKNHWVIYTDYHKHRGTIIYGVKTISPNYEGAIYSPHYATTLLVDCDYSSLYVVPRSYRAVTEGYTLKLKVVDKDGNPIQGAKVYIYDKNGNSAIFLPKLSSTGTFTYFTQTYTYGDNYGTADTTLTVNDASVFSVGEVIRADAERMLVTDVDTANNIITVERGYEGTPVVNHYNMKNGGYYTLETRYEYLTTDANGEIPRIILYTRDYASTTDFIERQPFTLRIESSAGTYETTFNLTKRTEWTIAVKPDGGGTTPPISESGAGYPIKVGIVSETLYYPNDTIDIEAYVINASSGQPIDTAVCNFDVWYPNKTKWLDDINTTLLENGVYYNNSFKAPDVAGVYTYQARCVVGNYSMYASKSFEVKEKVIGSASLERISVFIGLLTIAGAFIYMAFNSQTALAHGFRVAGYIFIMIAFIYGMTYGFVDKTVADIMSQAMIGLSSIELVIFIYNVFMHIRR